MPGKHALSVSLTEHLCKFVDQQVSNGHYRTTSEVVRAGLRLLGREQASARHPDDKGTPAHKVEAHSHANRASPAPQTKPSRRSVL
jgi:putative addiction module CopG family antidote